VTATQDAIDPGLAELEPLPVVNSHNHWSRLEEVIVGEPEHLTYHYDVSFNLFFAANLGTENGLADPEPWIPPDSDAERRLADEMAEDNAAFKDLLRREGVTVREPDPRPTAHVIQTADWTTLAGHSVMPRDNFIVIGNEVIETAPMVRARFLETDLYKKLLTEYFERGAKWTVAPRSRLRAENFDFSYVQSIGYTGPVPERPEYEIMFDGAQLIRLGRDILFNCSTENHRMGMRWLAQQIGPDYRLHEINVTDNHVDTRFVPLRPGTLLLHNDVTLDQVPEFMRGWRILRYSTPPDTLDRTIYGDRPVPASPALGMNILSIDEERIVVQHDQTALIETLSEAGFTPIPCRWRHGRVTCGGFHCMTLDIRRDSALESYRD
jgi:glycine amidinotransferase